MSERRGIGVEVVLALFSVAALVWAREPGAPKAFELTARDPEGLRIVTWNVGGTGGGRGRPLAEEHEASVVATLRALDADVVCLQELRGEGQLRRLADELGARSVRNDDGRIGAIALRGTLLPLAIEDWDRRPPLSFVYEHERGPRIHVVAVHAHPWSAGRRNDEIGRATQLLDPPTWAKTRLLVGDLNLDLDRRGRNDLFTDDEHLDVESYNFVAERFADVALGGGPTAEPDRRLDYVFADEERLESRRAGPWLDARVGDMDHHPLVADFAFR